MIARVALSRAAFYDNLRESLAMARAEAAANHDAADSLVRIMLSGLGKPASIKDAVWHDDDACLIVDFEGEQDATWREVILAIDPRDASVLGVFRHQAEGMSSSWGQAAVLVHILDPIWWAHVRQSAQSRVPLATRAIMIVVSREAERRLVGGS